MRRRNRRSGFTSLDVYDSGQCPAEFCQTDLRPAHVDLSVGETAADFLDVNPRAALAPRPTHTAFARELERHLTPVVKRMTDESARLELVDEAARAYAGGRATNRSSITVRRA
jgi:hypothetical protein